jgi:hypothetical protein
MIAQARLEDGHLRLAVPVDAEDLARQIQAVGPEFRNAVRIAVEVFGPCQVGLLALGPTAGADPDLDPADLARRADYIKRLFPSAVGRFVFVAGRYRPCSWRKTKLAKGECCHGMGYAHLVDPTAEHLADFSRTVCLCPAHARLARLVEEKGKFAEGPVVAAHVGGPKSELPDAGWAEVSEAFAGGRLRRLPKSFWDDLFDRVVRTDGGWPAEIEGLGVRHVQPLSWCADCDLEAHPSAAVTFAWYGSTPLCKRHANANVRGVQPETVVDLPGPAGSLDDLFDTPRIRKSEREENE